MRRLYDIYIFKDELYSTVFISRRRNGNKVISKDLFVRFCIQLVA